MVLFCKIKGLWFVRKIFKVYKVLFFVCLLYYSIHYVYKFIILSINWLVIKKLTTNDYEIKEVLP